MRNGSLCLQRITPTLIPPVKLLDIRLARYVDRRHVSTRLFKHAAGSHRASGARLAKADISKRQFTLGNDDDWTVFALSTAPGRAAIAIIRISGPACLGV